MNIIVITSHPQAEWDGGDSVITDGIFALLPELRNHTLTFSADVSVEDTRRVVAESGLLIHAGTPSWLTYDNRRFWLAAEAYKKPVFMFGIGLAVAYDQVAWYGGEAVMRLRDSGMLRQVVCRDKLAAYWLTRLGVTHERLPCPALYTLPVQPSQGKTRVVYSIGNPDETSASTPAVFRNYFKKSRDIISGLRQAGADVLVLYQRSWRKYPAFKECLASELPGEHVYSFDAAEEFAAFLHYRQVYIGVRNHGALPCAGAGKPSLLIGTDYRQHIADEVPFLSRIDASHAGWSAAEVLDWYRALEPVGVGQSLASYRGLSEARWGKALSAVKALL